MIITPPKGQEFIDIHVRTSPFACMELAPKVLDVGNLLIPELLRHQLTSVVAGHFQNAFFAEGGGLGMLLRELVAEYCQETRVSHTADTLLLPKHTVRAGPMSD